MQVYQLFYSGRSKDANSALCKLLSAFTLTTTFAGRVLLLQRSSDTSLYLDQPAKERSGYLHINRVHQGLHAESLGLNGQRDREVLRFRGFHIEYAQSRTKGASDSSPCGGWR